MYIRTPKHWRAAIYKLHDGDSDLLVSVLKDAVTTCCNVPDRLKEVEVALEQLAAESLQKQCRYYSGVGSLDSDMADVRAAMRTAVEWATAEAALPEFKRRLQVAAKRFDSSATMVTSDHAIVRMWSTEALDTCIDVLWINGTWQISGAHVDAASLHRLMKNLCETPSSASGTSAGTK